MRVSVGSAAYTEGVRTLQDLVHLADKELYQVKAARSDS